MIRIKSITKLLVKEYVANYALNIIDSLGVR